MFISEWTYRIERIQGKGQGKFVCGQHGALSPTTCALARSSASPSQTSHNRRKERSPRREQSQRRERSPRRRSLNRRRRGRSGSSSRREASFDSRCSRGRRPASCRGISSRSVTCHQRARGFCAPLWHRRRYFFFFWFVAGAISGECQRRYMYQKHLKWGL